MEVRAEVVLKRGHEAIGGKRWLLSEEQGTGIEFLADVLQFWVWECRAWAECLTMHPANIAEVVADIDV